MPPNRKAYPLELKLEAITIIGERYHTLVYTAQKVLQPYTPRTRYLPCSSKYPRDMAVPNANGVLVKLICDGSCPRFIRTYLLL